MKNRFRITWANARFEMMTLLRSWFFRIFAGMAVFSLTMFNIGVFSRWTQIPWVYQGLPSFMPYVNTLFLSLAQVVVILILATDVFKRDKKMNSVQVVYARSMSNLEYLFGKALGVLILFSLLDIVVLLITAVQHLTFGQPSFILLPYFIYPLLIALPTMVFVLGFSFLLMRIVRNQAITVVLLLGYSAIVLFYLGDKIFYVFDLFAFNQPLTFSGLVGIPGLDMIILQRAVYLLLGLTALFLTAAFFPRLPQSRLARNVSLAIGFLFTGLAAAALGLYLQQSAAAGELRASMRLLNSDLVKQNFLTPLSCKLDIRHNDNQLQGRAKLVFRNDDEQAMDRYLFTLNPDLKIQSVSDKAGDLKFERKIHTLTVVPSRELAPGDVDSLTINYSGGIDERVCAIDVDEGQRFDRFRIWIYNIAARQAFLTDDYALLTPDALWYPSPGLSYSMTFPEKNDHPFYHFELDLKTKPALMAVSQGSVQTDSSGNFSFRPGQDLQDISLVIGRFAKRSVSIGEKNVALYDYPDHAYYDEYFSELADTLAEVTALEVQAFEQKLGLTNPFKRIALVETPIQFKSLERLWSSGPSYVFPEQILFSEFGMLMNGSDLKNATRRQSRFSDRMNVTETEKEKQTALLKRMINSAFLGGAGGSRFIGDQERDMMKQMTIYPMYFRNALFFSSDRFPLLNLALESYFQNKTSAEGNLFASFVEDLTDAEKVCRELSKKSLNEFIADSLQSELLNEILKYKGTLLIKMLGAETGAEKFDTYISEVIEKNRFAQADVGVLLDPLAGEFDLDIEKMMDTWYSTRAISGYIVQDVRMFKFLDVDRIRYQVLFKLFNSESVDGYMDIGFRTGDRRRRMMSGGSAEEPPEKSLQLEAGQTVEVGIILDSEPRMMYINPTLARNIPLIFTRRFEKAELKRRYSGFEGLREIDEPLKLQAADEQIVDNEDAGFRVYNQEFQSWLKRMIQDSSTAEEEGFHRFQYWHPPNQWRLTKNPGFFGRHIHSARFIRSGKGDKNVEWTSEITNAGNYSVYTYILDPSSLRRGRRGGRHSIMGELHYTIMHDDGNDDVVIDAGSAAEGWNFLGSFYFSEGNAVVRLSDESDKRLVIADAVKWVKD